MNNSYPILPSRPILPHIATSCSNSRCNVALEFPVPTPQPRPGTLLQIRCFACQNIVSHAFYPGQVPSSSTVYTSRSGHRPSTSASGAPSRKGRKIGTQDRPLETGYYDILGVPVTATTDDIKKAYRRAAIKHHPDKNPDDPNAEERFKEIAIAYQTLSDDTLRRKYNEFGPKESAPEGGYVDPEEVFGAIFGGERFVPIIGNISLARDMKTALQEAEEAEGWADEQDGVPRPKDSKGREILTPEEKAKKEEKERVKAEKDRQKAAEKAAARAERVKKLVENMERKLSIFTESATGPDDPDVSSSWRTICQLEAEELKRESYGVELLQTIGFVYVSKAKHHLATNQLSSGKYHVFSETVSTLRAAIELKSVFDQIQAAEKAGNLSPEEKKRLEEQAAEKGLQALFKGTKLEVESILRETCERVLEDPTISREKAQLRAVAMQMLGEAYTGVKKDSEGGRADGRGEDSDYVKVDTKNSRRGIRSSTSTIRRRARAIPMRRRRIRLGVDDHDILDSIGSWTIFAVSIRHT
ncbi:X-domain of DnaJ-containing-domain-containing protein [Flammula alnicola]|nr:X-domain of DnaJ-containing-domain-containing protein [Flammula alnicola]